MRAALAKVGDIERLAVKLAVGRAVPRDLVALRKSLSSLPLLTEALDRCPDPSARGALGVPGAEAWLDQCRDVRARLDRAISDDFRCGRATPGSFATGLTRRSTNLDLS